MEEVLLFNKFFFRLSIHASAAKIQPDKIVPWCQSGDFLRPVFSASCVQHISDLHSKFAQRHNAVIILCVQCLHRTLCLLLVSRMKSFQIFQRFDSV